MQRWKPGTAWRALQGPPLADRPAGGIAVRCRADGTVIGVVRDALGMSARTQPGARLDALVDPAARGKLDAFVAAVLEQGASFDWEITVPLGTGLLPLHFAGVRTDEGMLVVAARTRNDLLSLNEEMLRMNNEQTNALRAISKELAAVSMRNRDHDDAVFEDLTRVNNELANLQREMARKNVELSLLNEEKNRFLGMAAHDLRSPLGVILTYSEFLEDEAAEALGRERLEFVSAIRTTSQFMLRLLDDLLDVSQIDAGKLVLDLQPVDLVALLRRNLGLNRVLATRKQIGILFEPGIGAVEIVADAAKIEQVLNNLVGNGIKFSPPGTDLDVRLTAGGGSAFVSVIDHGPGIPDDDLPKLFKPFSRTSVRPTGGEKSTGLGLAIVRRIVEGHGGTVTVESRVGLGSSFTFSLPRRTDAV
jgi:signal transduction histidine kinase